MLAPELKLNRPWIRIVATSTILICSMLLFRCGGNNNDKKNTDDTPPVIGPEVPGDWNGSEDWTGSTWKVTDE